MSTLAPIVLFAFARPEHTRLTLEALRANALAEQSSLIVYADAARHEQEVARVREVRELVRAAKGFRNVTVVERATNFGLARNIIEGVTEICARYGRVVVLEDDLVVSPFFLRFVNDALELYEDEDRVVSIAGYTYPARHALQSDTFFLKGTNCWGWATWKRGWAQFNPDGQFLLSELQRRKLTYEFDINGSYGYTSMLKDQILGKNDSWAVRWYASAFLNDQLTLMPSKSLVRNEGLDGSGVHCTSTGKKQFDVVVDDRPVAVERIPIEASAAYLMGLESYYRSVRRGSLWDRAKQLSRFAGIWNR